MTKVNTELLGNNFDIKIEAQTTTSQLKKCIHRPQSKIIDNNNDQKTQFIYFICSLFFIVNFNKCKQNYLHKGRCPICQGAVQTKPRVTLIAQIKAMKTKLVHLWYSKT